MTEGMILTFFAAIIISPFVGVIISYLFAKNKCNSTDVPVVMSLGAILSLVIVSMGLPLYWLVTI